MDGGIREFTVWAGECTAPCCLCLLACWGLGVFVVWDVCDVRCGGPCEGAWVLAGGWDGRMMWLLLVGDVSGSCI